MAIARQTTLYVAETVVPLPCFFPSVSSVKTNLMPVDYVELLDAAGHPLFLASAFDIAHCPSVRIPVQGCHLFRPKLPPPGGKFSTPDSDQTCHLLPGLTAV
jgi:hypothetical protein